MWIKQNQYSDYKEKHRNGAFFYQRIFVAYSETCTDVRAVFSNITSSMIQSIYLLSVYSFQTYRWYDWFGEYDFVPCATWFQSR